MKLPDVLIHSIFSYYNCIINEYTITFSILKKSIQLNKTYYLVTKLPIYKISHLKLKNIGITCILLDVDGTLLSRNSKIIPLNVKNWIN